jgi:hypothetical protein|tara:strand:- start:405 stop:650 length:246 start_codon:yes stop_codon:yes gene_type:complete
MKNNELKELAEFIILYFQSRNLQNWFWVGYKNFKVLITYITGIRDVDTLRMIFEKMVNLGHFKKRKIYSKTEYLFLFNAEC